MSNFNKERAGSFYRFLSQPWVYKFSLALLSPGYQANLSRRIKAVIESFPNARSYLDVGCGPHSWLNDLGLDVTGVDISYAYVASQASRGKPGVVGSADLLPFKTETFDAVWTVGMFHHLPTPMFRMACSEMLRVCVPGGYVAIIDAVLPHSTWSRPIPALLRKLDRGRYVRAQDHFESLAKDLGNWSFERYTYTYNGLEAVFALLIKET